MIYILLADGFEETEALACCDMIRRGELEARLASIGEEYVTGSHKMTVKADMAAKDIDFKEIDAVVLPGGMPGTLNLKADKTVAGIIEHCARNEKLIAAICAAPMILGDMGLLDGKRATCFPGYEDTLTGAELLSDAVVCDKNFITARGAGASLLFGAAIVDYFKEGTGTRLLRQVQHI